MRILGRLFPAAFAAAALGCATSPRDEAAPPQDAAVAAGETKTPEPVDPPLVSDPSLVKGALDNGFSYVVLRHAVPAGRVAAWLHVGSGSLNETEEQRGIAHFLEHMAFNGSEHFPPGSVVPYFQALGLRFGNDQNAFTNYEQTTFQLALPNPRPETVDKALLFFGDVASRLSFIPKEIDDERQIILEEKRARGGPATRVREALGERLAPESTFGRRNPIGVEEQIRRFTAADFKDYYGRWYVPSNMTLLVVGDVEPASVVDSIRKAFGGAPSALRPTPREVGVSPTQGRRAAVVTDAEITNCDVSVVRVAPPRAPTTTTSQLRREIVESLAVSAFDRRVRRLTASGQASFLEADCGVRDVLGAMTQFRVHARAVAKNWKKNLADLGVALQRARLHGFSAREIDDVRAQMTADAEEAADRESSTPARQLLARMNAEVAAGEPILSAAQRLDALRALLPGITAEETSAAFAEAFDTKDALFTIEIPSGESPPTEDEFLTTAAAAVDVTPEAAPEVEAPTIVLPDAPAGGTIAETSRHAGSGVTSAWLGNGVRVHVRRMTERRNEATIAIHVAAGAIEETAKDRGIAEAAEQSWAQPAAGEFTSTQIRDWLVGKKVHLRSAVAEDVLSLNVSGETSDLEHGLRLARLLLTEPVVENRTIGGWKRRVRQAADARKLLPAGLLDDAVGETFFGKDAVRLRPLEREQADRIGMAAAQTWLRTALKTQPIEVAVVGDVEPDAALALVAKYLGALPARPRMTSTTFADLRRLARPKGPIDVERPIDVKTSEAFVYDGFFGPDATERDDARRLELAAQVLTSRMIAEIRERRQLVYSVRAASQPAAIFPGFGTFGVRVPTDPAKGAELAGALEEMFAAFAKDGPTDEEIDVAKRQTAVRLDEEHGTAAFWLGVLGTLDYRGGNLDEVVGASAAYQKITASEVHDAFAKRYVPENRFRFVVTPSGSVQR